MKFRKKPVIIEAVQWTGNNFDEVKEFVNTSAIAKETTTDCLLVRTLEGVMRASVGDWIIKGVHGEFYPCKPDIFEQTYKPVIDED